MPSAQQNYRRGSSRAPSRPASSRIENVRTGINQLFSGRSSVGRTRLYDVETPDSPKTPRLPMGLPLQNFSTTRLAIPYLNRTSINASERSHHSPISSPTSAYNPATPISSRPITPNSLRQQTQPPVASQPSHVRQNSAPRFVGVDPAEVHLAELAQVGRQRRKYKCKRTGRRCGPKISNRRIRAKMLSCFVSGLFLALILTIYLALALTNRSQSQEFHVLLILIILITTIFFCHSLVRLCMMLVHPPPDVDEPRLPAMAEPGGYANPAEPIRVALARDEEAAGIESEATKFPPPAYGLWRESVRVDPNRIFWQRNTSAPVELPTSDSQRGRPVTATRPPSYVSENGIDYVVEAAPRSIAPTMDVPLPVHPSERGRVWPGTRHERTR